LSASISRIATVNSKCTPNWNRCRSGKKSDI
jgi:hypothetical protein